MISRHSESGSERFETSSLVIFLDGPADLAVISSIATGVLSTGEGFVSLLVLMHMIPITSSSSANSTSVRKTCDLFSMNESGELSKNFAKCAFFRWRTGAL